MLVALPSAIAFGVAIYAVFGPDYVAEGAMAGILGTVAIGMTAPLLGGAPRLISAPCAPAMAVTVAFATTLLKPSSPGATAISPTQVLLLLTLVALMSGGLQILYGVLRAGRFIKYIPYPVVAGYMSAVAVKIFLGQMPKLFGWPGGLDLFDGLTHPSLWAWPGVCVGIVTMVVMASAPRVTKAIPAPVLGLLAGIATYFLLALGNSSLLRLEHNPLLVGLIGGASELRLTTVIERWRAIGALDLGEMSGLLSQAVTLSVLLSIDTLKTCVVLDALTRTRHRSNRELIGQGVANVASALVGGVPGAGTMGATLVNLNSGGATRLSGFLEGVFALVAFVLLGGLIGWVPLAALAGILIVVACRMFDKTSFRLLEHRSTVLDLLVILAVVIVAMAFDLIAAAGAGFGLAILLFIREQMQGSVIRRRFHASEMSSKRHRLSAEKEALLHSGEAITVCELQGSLFFGTTDRLYTELELDLKRSRFVILDLRRVQSVDFTAAHLLEQIEAVLAERQAMLLFSNLPQSLPSGQDVAAYFKEVGLVRPARHVKVFDSLAEALEWAEDQFLGQAGFPRESSERALGVREFELFSEFESDHVLAPLADCLVERSCAVGTTIFRNGDPGDELFVIRRGLVRIFLPLGHNKHLVLATFGPGDFFGDVAFLDRSRRSADAVALAATDLYVLSRARFDQLSVAHPVLGAKMFARLARMLAHRLRHSDKELRALQEA
jgi:SulP family sulfate permease